ncbi:hypothetical protein SB87_gp115 [Parapoxvirus red deer/HL953]|uniref:Uncharacterized protein n=1 Tax=Parapoxvirus red deer/HL953 TaxID=1579460 RepID=A0A0A7MAC3_9POXV|nr:hypothetical protein SB87_gp115 [Parapoxvirus red deer/HL953]AIZ77368.1 hypothetical protein [Parapoxvirus red deer/HL953]
MPLFRRLMVPRALVRESLTLDFRHGTRIPSRCYLPTPPGMIFQRLCDTSALAAEVSKGLGEPVVAAGTVNFLYFEQGQGMIGENVAGSRILLCTRSAYTGGDIVLRCTRTREKTVICPCQGMALVISPFCAVDVTPVESGSVVLAEIPVSAPSFDHLELSCPGDAGVRLFNSGAMLWPRHGSQVCFAFRLLRDARTGDRVAEQLFIDGQWFSLLRLPGERRICVPADLVGTTHIDEVPFCDVTPEIMQRVVAVEPPYDAVAFARRCTHGAIEVKCALESIIYGSFRTEAPRRAPSPPAAAGAAAPDDDSDDQQSARSPTSALVDACVQRVLCLDE